jgi:hypothetical protein
MSRRIVAPIVESRLETKVTPPEGTTDPSRLEAKKSETGDDYVGRLAKYIPAEVVGLYLAAIGTVPATAPGRAKVLCIIYWFCLIATPVYLALTTREGTKGPLWIQVILATIAFPVWVLAIGGGCYALNPDSQYIASLVLLAVTFLFGLVKVPAEKA